MGCRGGSKSGIRISSKNNHQHHHVHLNHSLKEETPWVINYLWLEDTSQFSDYLNEGKCVLE